MSEKLNRNGIKDFSDYRALKKERKNKEKREETLADPMLCTHIFDAGFPNNRKCSKCYLPEREFNNVV